MFALGYDRLYEFHDNEISNVGGPLSSETMELSITTDMTKPYHEVLSIEDGAFFSNCDIELLNSVAAAYGSDTMISAALLVSSTDRRVWQANLATIKFSWDYSVPHSFLESSAFTEYVLDPTWNESRHILKAWLNSGNVLVWLDDFNVY